VKHYYKYNILILYNYTLNLSISYRVEIMKLHVSPGSSYFHFHIGDFKSYIKYLWKRFIDRFKFSSKFEG